MNKITGSTKEIVELIIRMAVLILLLFYCFEILAPFIMPVLWAIIIAVSVYPIHISFTKTLGGKEKLSATIITIAILSFIFIPVGLFISSISDNILKHILLGKGAQVPMLVIFLGVVGGFFLSGFIGLFTGAIILSIGYKLFLVWMHDQEIEEEKIYDL